MKGGEMIVDRITIHVSPKIGQIIRSQAKKEGLSMNKFIEKVVEAYIKGIEGSQSQSEPLSKEEHN